MDYFATTPDDVIVLVFSFVSLSCLWNLFLTNKKFNKILSSKENQQLWKNQCLVFFQDYKDALKDNPKFEDNHNIKFYHLPLTNEECRNSWKWVAECFLTGSIDVGECEITIGRDGYRIEICNYGSFSAFYNDDDHVVGDVIYSVENKKYIGEWNGGYHGNGKLTYKKTGISYEGQWDHGDLVGPGTITYPDGTSYQGLWDNEPQFDALHPVIKDYIEKGKCTNTLKNLYPQRMACAGKSHRFCQPCWTKCMNNNPESLIWKKHGGKCNCKCSMKK
jgi:hypothetical protein